MYWVLIAPLLFFVCCNRDGFVSDPDLIDLLSTHALFSPSTPDDDLSMILFSASTMSVGPIAGVDHIYRTVRTLLETTQRSFLPRMQELLSLANWQTYLGL